MSGVIDAVFAERERDEVSEFYAQHCKLPSGVVLVWADDGTMAVFSTYERATEWGSRQPQSLVYAPYVIDEPDYGNVPKDRMA